MFLTLARKCLPSSVERLRMGINRSLGDNRQAKFVKKMKNARRYGPTEIQNVNMKPKL